MKTIRGVLVLLVACFIDGYTGAEAQPASQFVRPTNSPYAALRNPVFTNIPGALATISNLLAMPAPAQTMPLLSTRGPNPSGTFYSLQWPTQPPLPGNFFPTLPVYELSVSNRIFLLDDRSVDYVALQRQQDAINATNDEAGLVLHANAQIINTNSLWLSVATNALPGTNLFNIVIHDTVEGSFYDVLTKVDLLLPAWTVESTVMGAVGDATPVTLTQNERTNLFVWARETIIPIYWQPMSQEVFVGDTVTFRVVAGGDGLTYQWTFNGTNIFGATGSSYTIDYASYDNAGDYVCIITNPNGSVTSQTATLWMDSWTHAPFGMVVFGQRQDYTFRKGTTYLVDSTVQLAGTTTIEGGTVIKFDITQPYPCLQVLGSLVTKAGIYDPAVLTSAYDLSIGANFYSQVFPSPVYTGAPFVDLSAATDVSLDNVHFRYADVAVSTPYHRRLDVWNSQFFHCNSAAINEFGGVDSFHNVLFAGCEDVVYAFTNQFVFEAEHITADVSQLWEGPVCPDRASVTNSIIFGSLGSATVRTVSQTEFNPDPTNFRTSGMGNYYLAESSAFHQSGNTNLGLRLRTELGRRTTHTPMVFPAFMNNNGSLTLYPRAPRYTGGAPDLGYYYDALDYTVAWMTNAGSITLEPGTAVGARNELDATTGVYTWWGFDLREESSIVSHGLPGRPNVIADTQRVQEQNSRPNCALFLPDCQSQPPVTGPALDLRFTEFYAGFGWYHVWSGFDENGSYLASLNSVVNWTMKDCAFHGGWINLGRPDDGSSGGHGLAPTNFYGSGTLNWRNNLFEDCGINLDPGYYWEDGTVNVDLAVTLQNNLFWHDSPIILVPIPATAGNWQLTDNLFDHAEFFQDPTFPWDLEHNAYWPLKQTLYANDSVQLQAAGTNGQNAVVLDYPLNYQKSAFGNYYLNTLTSLYEAGSRTAAEAGLSQYTTFTNQAKDSASQLVNIGLHYIAASNSLPLDSDGDGVPDYVEAEHNTDPTLASTDGVTNDTYNIAYDDVDLSGNGLVGRIKKALGLEPLDSNNPLTLSQVGLDVDRGIASFELPISYATLTNIGSLNLNLNGIDASLEDFIRATNGNSLLSWNTLYDPPGQHYIQAEITLNGTGDDHAIISGRGKLAPYYSDNVVRFFESDAMFDDTSAFLDAQLPVQNADYVIRLYDTTTTPPALMKTITNSTANGTIQEDWNFSVDGSLDPFAGSSFTAEFDVTLLDAPGGSPITQKQQPNNYNRIKTRERIDPNALDGFDVVYFYTPSNNVLTSMFDQGEVRYGMQGVVDTLMQPSFGCDVYYSHFNIYRFYDNTEGYSGYITSQTNGIHSVWNGLYPDMANGTTKEFFGYGHGSKKTLASKNNAGAISAFEVAFVLGNQFNSHGLSVTNPYRFVFLDGCSTASGKDWRRAFGIFPAWVTNQPGRPKLGPQAFVGWANDKSDYFGGAYDTNWVLQVDVSKIQASAYAATLQWFFMDWMNGASLAECIKDASNTNVVPCAFPVPSNQKFIGNMNGQRFRVNNTTNTSLIYVVGHSGLTISGLKTQDDNQFVSPLDSPP